MSTVKIFILIVIVFVIAVIFLAGTNPFSFGEAYFRPRANQQPVTAQPSDVVLPADSAPEKVRIDR